MSLNSKLSVGGGVSVGVSYDTVSAPTNGLIVEGNVGIGTTTPSEKLTVVGNVYADAFIDNGITIGAPDYVFDDPSYEQLSLEEIEAFVEENYHLPWLTPRGPGAMSLSARINEVLEALENIFLRVFELVDWNEEQDARDEALEARIAELEAQNERMAELIEDLTGEPLPTPASEPDSPTNPDTEPISGEEAEPTTDDPGTTDPEAPAEGNEAPAATEPTAEPTSDPATDPTAEETTADPSTDEAVDETPAEEAETPPAEEPEAATTPAGDTTPKTT